MRLVRWCVRAGLRQDWRGVALLTLITALMGYSQFSAYLLVMPVAVDGRPVTGLGQGGAVSTLAAIDVPPQVRSILLVGRYATASRADEAMVSESAARQFGLHVGLVLRMAGYRPGQCHRGCSGPDRRPRPARCRPQNRIGSEIS